MPEDVLTGFFDEKGDAHCRPVGVAVDKSGALLVADDVGNTVWRVTPRGQDQSPSFTDTGPLWVVSVTMRAPEPRSIRRGQRGP
jgi:NHL repeat